jgi:hypothetical protein
MLRPDHDEQHFELGSRFQRMRSIRRQDDGLPLPHLETLACNLNVGFTVSDNYKRIERRGMLAKALAHIKREQCNRAALVLQQHAAHDRAILVLQQVNELLDLSRSNYTLILITHNG